ncbi:phospholipase A2 inhibitor and Ly6/PLAUR domain-containing protein-like [Erythrolamprus reginae]|uniref:phospholipase A2 inhibitor and Ly6/PLAUR domain-containing protein-like n=1 Tax=Erythrolamprus reginae TaxID=121349 RepID=UPI00396C4567
MTSLSSLSFLLATLLTQGSCLICETCKDPGKDCTGSSQTCGEGEDACLTFVGINSLWSGVTTETVKGCFSRSECAPGPISVTVNSEIWFQSSFSCCHEDLCNNKKLDVPPENTTLNGVSCPACFNFGSDQCEDINSLNCKGRDNHCITTTGTIAAGDVPSPFISRGCGSDSACALPVDIEIYSAGVTFRLKKVECVKANSS